MYEIEDTPEPTKLCSLQLDSGELPSGYGTPDDIPETMGPACQRLMADDVRRRLDREELNGLTLTPGECRFCGKRLPLTFSVIEGWGNMPIYQCNRATKLWDRAEQIRLNRVARAREAMGEATQTRSTRNYY